MEEQDWPQTLEEAARDEQMHLWADLETAIRYALGTDWSIQCENLAYRIVALARIMGATPWDRVATTLLRSGVYERVLREAGIVYPRINWERVAWVEAYIAAGVPR